MVRMIGWWGGNSNIQDTWFQNFFIECSKDYIIDHDNICIISLFGDYNNIINCDKSKVNIYFTGENTYRKEYSCYSNEEDISTYVDSVCGFFNNTKKSIRFPLWMIYWRYDLYGLFKPIQQFKKNKAITIISHDSIDGFRNNACQELIKYGLQIDTNNPVIKNSNIISVGPHVSGKLDCLKLYKYNICFENTIQQGYTTEKIFDSLIGGCFPIYRGNKPVEPFILKQDQIIYIDELDKLKSLDNSEFNPMFWTDNALIYIYSVYLKLWSVVINKLKPTKKQVYNKISYNCVSDNDCIDKLIEHWKTYNNFYSPRAEFILQDNTVLWMEDIADKIYNKFNLHY